MLTVSQFLSDRLTDLFAIPPERLRVVGNGVEDEYYQPGPLPDRWSAATAQPYVLAVGGLMQWKGADAVLALARELQRPAARPCRLSSPDTTSHSTSPSRRRSQTCFGLATSASKTAWLR